MFPFPPVLTVINDSFAPEVETSAGSFNISAQRNPYKPAHSCLYKSWGRIKLSRIDVTPEYKSLCALNNRFGHSEFFSVCNRSSSDKDFWRPSKKDGKLIVKCSFACFERGTRASGRGEAYQDQCSRATFFFSVGLIWQETWVFHTRELHVQAPPNIHLQRMKTPMPGKRCLQPKDNLWSASTPAFPSTTTRTRQ